MAKPRFQIRSISLVGAGGARTVLVDLDAAEAWREAEAERKAAELEDIIGSAMEFAVQRRQQKAAGSPRVKPTDAEIVTTFEASVATLGGGRVKTAAIQTTAAILGISVNTVKRRLRNCFGS